MPPDVADIVAVVFAADVAVLTVKVTEALPGGIVTVLGTVAEA